MFGGIEEKMEKVKEIRKKMKRKENQQFSDSRTMELQQRTDLHFKR